MDKSLWNKTLDRYLTENIMSSDEWEKLDDMQKIIINEIKKSIARLNKREILTTHHSLNKHE
jgi:Fe-S cluster biosynthesis and repair protein YggX